MGPSPEGYIYITYIFKRKYIDHNLIITIYSNVNFKIKYSKYCLSLHIIIQLSQIKSFYITEHLIRSGIFKKGNSISRYFESTNLLLPTTRVVSPREYERKKERIERNSLIQIPSKSK